MPGVDKLTPAIRFELDVLLLYRDGRLPQDVLSLPIREFRRWRTALHVLLTMRAHASKPPPNPSRRPRR